MNRIWLSKFFAGLATVALAALILPAAASADPFNGSFSNFGNARLVIGGIPPDNAAVDLTSNCGNEPFSPTCYADPTFTYSGVAFTPNNPATLSNLTTLSTDANVGGSNCGGGSPRIAIQGSSGTITCGYFGQNPISFNSCDFGWLNTGNWASAADTTIRWDSGCNGTASLDWAGVQAAFGSQSVTEIDIIVDGGWTAAQGQDLTVDNFTVNRNVLTSANTPPRFHNHQHDHCGGR
jgi:hypothetical protein